MTRKNSTSCIGKTVLAMTATISLAASMCPGAMALADDDGQLAAISGDAEMQRLSVQEVPDAPGEAQPITASTHALDSGSYKVTGNVEIKPDGSGNAIQVKAGAKVLIFLEEGSSLSVTGEDAKGSGIGHAAILLPEGSSLTVAGKGTLTATGGRAGNGSDGGAAEQSHIWEGSPSSTGRGGHGGTGGGGAGAGIGTDGGAGGEGGEGGERAHSQGLSTSNIYGNDGKPGSAGNAAAPAGTVIVTDTATVNAKGGGSGEKGGAAGNRGRYAEDGKKFGANTSAGTSGGGGGGAAGSAADGIGSGGTGGGGGGGGASGNFDGEFAFLIKGDLDDLWGHGGSGGYSAWGGSSGARGDEGASNGGDDTGASRKYAKSGGVGGDCMPPKAVSFYIYEVPGSSSHPTVQCVSGVNVNRDAIHLTSLIALAKISGLSGKISGGTFTYDGNQHGVSVESSGDSGVRANSDLMLRIQADTAEVNDAGTGNAFSGSVTMDGVTYSYSIEYYDENGTQLDEEPRMPGQYMAVVTFKDADGTPVDCWTEPITITKHEVSKPTPAELVFECENWETGEGAEQDAFPGLDETDYEFVADATAVDGASSLRSAKEAGEYAACFRLKDPATCQWEGESEDAEEVWVPWSIKLQEFDPNDVSYWGTAHDNTTTAVTYTGEPIWVRPWYTYTKDADGEFPEWYTHWGSANRPTTARNSAAILYIQGEDDEQGLIGYHTNNDGTFEPVTGAQVYAWANGVDVDGRHIDLESGEKVWYKVGEDGWWVPVAVQDEEPADAEGFVIARDYAYADRLGVMEPGTYQAYALFDEGAGFAPIALAEASVEVVKAPGEDEAESTPAPEAQESDLNAPGKDTSKDGSAKTANSNPSQLPKTGDTTLYIIGGAALAALLSIGAMVLAFRHRRG